ncbi:hypothetical protein [Actinomadura gamaensis]|uniref:Uncharacterized protein n=1 Tax=Actinomadura gamaensis TaxID=1763541 RepID=A0ABV9UB42_9ACTN
MDRPRSRSGISRYLSSVIDDTRDFLDDVLDRGSEVERDVRGTVRRAVETRDGGRRRNRYRNDRREDDPEYDEFEYDEDRGRGRRYDLDAELRDRLADLRDDLDRLSRRLDTLTDERAETAEKGAS